MKEHEAQTGLSELTNQEAIDKLPQPASFMLSKTQLLTRRGSQLQAKAMKL